MIEEKIEKCSKTPGRHSDAIYVKRVDKHYCPYEGSCRFKDEEQTNDNLCRCVKYEVYRFLING